MFSGSNSRLCLYMLLAMSASLPCNRSPSHCSRSASDTLGGAPLFAGGFAGSCTGSAPSTPPLEPGLDPPPAPPPPPPLLPGLDLPPPCCDPGLDVLIGSSSGSSLSLTRRFSLAVGNTSAF
jgi:hypothetical protein